MGDDLGQVRGESLQQPVGIGFAAGVVSQFQGVVVVADAQPTVQEKSQPIGLMEQVAALLPDVGMAIAQPKQFGEAGGSAQNGMPRRCHLANFVYHIPGAAVVVQNGFG